MHQLGGVRDGAAERLRDSLMPQTHAKQGFMDLRSPANGIDNDPGFCGGAGSRRDEKAVVLGSHCENGIKVILVIADYGCFGSELLQISDEGEHKTIVIIDNQDAGHGFSFGKRR